MSVLSNLLIALAIAACDAGVVRDSPVLQYGVKNVASEGVYKPVVGYQINPGYAVPKGPLPVAGFGDGHVPAGGTIRGLGALPFGAAIGGPRPFGNYRSLFGESVLPYGGEAVSARGLGRGIRPVAAPVKEIKDYVAPVALKEYSAPVVFAEYVPKVAAREYAAPVALQGYAGPVGYPGRQVGYLGAQYVPNVVPAVGYGVPGVIAQEYPAALAVRGYSGPFVPPQQNGYGVVKNIDW